MLKIRALLLVTTMLPLAACGADDIASPGEGVIIVPTPTPTPPTTPPGTPPPPTTPPGGPASACVAGTIDRGVTANRRVCELPGRFSVDTSLANVPGLVYQIAGPTNVGTDCGGTVAPIAGCQAVTLTVQPGAIFIAQSGNDYLVVNRGSRINAVGSATQPIIFTHISNLNGTVTDSSQGLWGGIILLGRAPISDCNTAVPGGSPTCQQVIEGTTSSLYGGDRPDDNSGSMRFVQIRYSGFQIAPGNELQGLTMGGVGQLTTIDHIQVHNSSDDAVEIFGGRVNTKYLALTGPDDDGLDTDLGYRGTNQFIVYVQRPGGTDRGNTAIEADSNGNEDALPRQYTRVSNLTAVQTNYATSVDGNLLTLRGGTDYALLNSVLRSTQACIDIDETGGTTTRAADTALQDLGPIVFRSVVASCGTPFRDDGNVAVAVATATFGSGTNNNNSNYTPTLTNVFLNGPTETAVPVTNPTTFNADTFAGTGQPNAAAPNRFEAVTFIGAVNGSADTNFQGWTCNSGYASFGGSGGSCTALPTS